MHRESKYILVYLLIFLMQAISLPAKKASFAMEEWKKKLHAETDPNNENFREINNQLMGIDTSACFAALDELERGFKTENLFFSARVRCLKAIATFRSVYPRKETSVKIMFDDALKDAYQTEDEPLISYISWRYGTQMYGYGEIELAAIYCLRAVEVSNNFLDQSYGYNYASELGEVLFHCREYQKSIYYSRFSIAHWPDTSVVHDSYCTKIWNTIGQAYQRLGMPDSAMSCYERSMALANKTKVDLWKAIDAGYEGQILFLKKKYQDASPLLAYDYLIARNSDMNIAASALEWLARIHLLEGKTDSALVQSKEAIRLLSLEGPVFHQKADYRQQALYTTADAYRSMGNIDSFDRYFQQYSLLHDSLERVAARSSFDIAAMRNDNEKKFYAIQVMRRERQAQERQRNLVIAIILFLAAIVGLLVNRKQIKLKHQQQLAMQEKISVEQEMQAAKSQLSMFTQHIIEKTNMVEQLEQQLHHHITSSNDQQVIEALSNQTILTEADWEKFRSLFEKIFPLFFQRLKNKAPEITMAEQRMAALTRIQLTSRQMAAILGISLDSVNKSKQRLRKRFGLGIDANLEQHIAVI